MRLFRRRKPIPKAAVRLWLSDTTGVLRPAVESYLAGGSMRSADVAIARDYLREWIMAPGWVQDQDLDRLRTWVNELQTPDDIQAWLVLATYYGIDPLIGEKRETPDRMV
jgi:hypothetical protein